MLIVYIATGLAFMLLPGTLVGVMNLLTISASHTSRAADAGWVQAHGHAQIFGWLGTFILGIGYYAIPRLRLASWSPIAAWTTYVLWTIGVATRWAVGTWPWHWQVLFPVASMLELIAVLIFCVSVFFARPRARDDKWRTSIIMITAGGIGMFVAVAVGAWMSFQITEPLFAFAFNQRYLALITWGFIVPFVWGFSTRWLPPLLGLRKTRKSWLLPSLGIVFVGVALNSPVLLLIASLMFAMALRMWEPLEHEPKLRGVHESTPTFLRIAYAWLAIAAALAIVSSSLPMPNGWAGASRHALTVGFFTVAVFCIGPRVLPAFFGRRRLWSPRLMAMVLVLINLGCTLRVTSQILAYQGISATAWHVLPLSAIIEMTAVVLFAVNMMMSLTTGTPMDTFLEAQSAERRAQRNEGNA
jgi:hypothetical protein